MNHRSKVVVGAEDGALNIFNVNEYGNISDRFPLNCSRRNFGNCSVDALEVISDSLLVATGSDCKLRLVQIFPNRVLFAATEYENSVESLSWDAEKELILSTETNAVIVHKLVEIEGNNGHEVEMEDDQDGGGDDSDDDSDDSNDSGEDQSLAKRKTPDKREASSNPSNKFFADL